MEKKKEEEASSTLPGHEPVHNPIKPAPAEVDPSADLDTRRKGKEKMLEGKQTRCSWTAAAM